MVGVGRGGRLTGGGMCLWQAEETKPAHYWPERTDAETGKIKAANIAEHRRAMRTVQRADRRQGVWWFGASLRRFHHRVTAAYFGVGCHGALSPGQLSVRPVRRVHVGH